MQLDMTAALEFEQNLYTDFLSQCPHGTILVFLLNKLVI